ncbi:hypothetical protein B0A55_08096 [Friedmanniomyces simplex]|uniref:Uncharacterized protein n=1 Tax=Friedmanniomyces simplex TaxID=329884 RepID=A0A4U0X658_9PEZI|nr:hypothetical protein B0A55_08096 [Friedmanniomyces simplex]
MKASETRDASDTLFSPGGHQAAGANTCTLSRPDRRRDEPFQDQYRGGGGQSYRPGGARSPPPPRPAIDSYRARSPPRRPDFIDSYRAAPRPRSRTPPPRRDEVRRRSPSPARYRDARDVRGDSYRSRPRSPPPLARREELPRDDLFRREPPAREYGRDERDFRDGREYGRDERERAYGGGAAAVPRYRERSPLPLKRAREPSPVNSRGRRTPPPKRERIASPPRARYEEFPPARAASPPRRRYSPDARDRRPASPPRGVTRDYRLRSRSPLARNERVDPRAVDDWRRPRSPSPARYAGRQQDYPMEDAGRDSVATSRRSSPPVHPSRLALQQPPLDDRASRALPARDPYEREPFRAAEPGRRRDSPPPRERESLDNRYASADDRVPPPREPYRTDDLPPQRAPPAGPAGYRAPSTSMAPPTGPAAAAPVPISAHQRAPAAPPSGPRGAMAVPQSAPRGDFGAPRGRGGFRGGFGGPPFRGGRGGGGAGGLPLGFGGRGGGNFGGGGGGRETMEVTTDFTTPAGPRGSFSQQGPAAATALPAGPQGFRSSSNSTATTYPRSQRFAPNGQPIPDGPSPSQAAMSPNNAEKLRQIIEQKEARKRKGIREWGRLEREVRVAGLRGELAEGGVRGLEGEAAGFGEGGFGEGAYGVGGMAAF